MKSSFYRPLRRAESVVQRAVIFISRRKKWTEKEMQIASATTYFYYFCTTVSKLYWRV